MNITTGPVEAYIDTFYKPLNGALEALRVQAEDEGIPIILKSTEMFLLNMINIKRPKHILEIGTAVGYSTACFAEKGNGCSVTSIELDERMYKRAVRNLSDLNLSERATVIQGDAETVIREQLAGRKFDFVFIDASKSHYTRFFDVAVTVCADGALIISDNVLLSGGTAADFYVSNRRNMTHVRNMRKYIAYITSLNYADTSILPIGCGVAVTVLNDG